MPYFSGQPYHRGAVSIGPPDLSARNALVLAGDVRTAVRAALDAAPMRADVTYFWIYEAGRPVGQILLHDAAAAMGESLVAYHLFTPADRGRGIGKTALALLQEHVAATTPLRQLIIITSHDNLGSQRLAQSCGFSYRGPARENAQLLVFRWDVPEHTSSQALPTG